MLYMAYPPGSAKATSQRLSARLVQVFLKAITFHGLSAGLHERAIFHAQSG
jgi:hypothetical protein